MVENAEKPQDINTPQRIALTGSGWKKIRAEMPQESPVVASEAPTNPEEPPKGFQKIPETPKEGPRHAHPILVKPKSRLERARSAPGGPK